MKEYSIEDGGEVDVEKLRQPFMPQSMYQLAHQFLPIVCHDVAIHYQDGLLLVERKQKPAMGDVFPIGGRLQKGMSLEDSLKRKAREECGLDISGIQLIDVVRTYWRTNPFGTEHGTDNVVFQYYARGDGKISLDETSAKYFLIEPSHWETKLKGMTHPYVRDMLDAAFRVVKEGARNI